jgi:hypothetical protein
MLGYGRRVSLILGHSHRKELSLILKDNFDMFSIDTIGSTWQRDVEMGGFGYVYSLCFIEFLLGFVKD